MRLVRFIKFIVLSAIHFNSARIIKFATQFKIFNRNMAKALATFAAIFLIINLAACEKEKRLENFDNQLWKNDPKGCLGFRAKLADGLLRQRNTLMGWTDDQVVELLGKPDRTDLHTRGQKYFVYYTEAGRQCSDLYSTTGKPLKIRFSALNLVNEVYLEP